MKKSLCYFITLFFTLSLFSLSTVGQYKTMERTVFYDSPEGKPIFDLVKNTTVKLNKIVNGWQYFEWIETYIKKNDVVNGVAPKGSLLYDDKTLVVGKLLADIALDSSRLQNSLDTTTNKLYLELTGFVKKGIIHEVTIDEIAKSRVCLINLRGSSEFLVYNDTTDGDTVHRVKEVVTEFAIVEKDNDRLNYDVIKKKSTAMGYPSSFF